MTEEIKASIIIEMMGRPESHIKQVMKELLEKLGQEKGVKVLEKNIHKPKKVEQKDKEGKIIKIPEGQEMYSTFSEVEIECEQLLDLIKIVFAYMPSHLEIISPTDLRINNFYFSTILTEITRKMHQYDAIAKNAIMQNQALAQRIVQMQTLLQNHGIDGGIRIQKEGAEKKLKKKKASKKNISKPHKNIKKKK